MSTQIKLSDRVRVSDPCYDNDVWCKTTVDNVLPGIYNVEVEKSDEGSWGNRVSRLTVLHESVIDNGNLEWYEDGADIGVDSGQAGIFCESTYRNDEVAASITTPDVNFSLGEYRKDKESGEEWYEKMCKFTLSEQQWGSYDTGVVTCSGYGDGGYPLELVEDKDGKIVGMRVTYIFPEDEEYDEEDEEDMDDES